jgi:WXG100 family type VII secretion target
MSYIKVPYNEMIQRAGVIQQQSEAVLAEVARLSQTVDSLDWMGQRATKFKDLWGRARPQMEEWAKILEDFATELRLQGERMKHVDESF